jgi:hypothetical protein
MIHSLDAVCIFFLILCENHPCAFRALILGMHLMLLMHGTGLTKEADCALCAPGTYQTGVGLIAEANCTWCVAGKYQSGSGLDANETSLTSYSKFKILFRCSTGLLFERRYKNFSV